MSSLPWIAGALGSSAISALGQMYTNSANAKAQRENNDLQLELANTGYQRAMADMKKAGINPILAAQSSPAGMPATQASLSQNSFGDLSSVLSNTARQTMALQEFELKQARQIAEVSLIEAQTKNTQINGLLTARKLPEARARSLFYDLPHIQKYGAWYFNPATSALSHVAHLGSLSKLLDSLKPPGDTYSYHYDGTYK